MQLNKSATPPTGLSRLLFRIPIHLYRMKLGFLLGGRFMLINHVGRVSGKPRQVVVEVVNHDAVEGGYVAASGFGRDAAWYRNLRQTPDTTIQVGRRTIPVTATFLSSEEGAGLMARYGQRHPRAAKALSRLMGFSVDGSEADFRAVGERVPFVRFIPRARPEDQRRSPSSDR
jgi:deazaflavin-dependent oxidoreductase (nitroreductase family)